MKKKYTWGWFSLWAGVVVVAAGLGVVLSGTAGCERKPKMNVVIITMDTTRADHLRCYGYDRIETPNLNNLARQGVLFERAYSHMPLTLPAHTAIMTGVPPRVHGVIDNGGYRVPDELVTLAEVLGARGYQTGAFISAAVLKKIFNLNQGFERWDEEGIEPQEQGSALVAERKGDKTADAALAWLDEVGDQPFFMWVHLYDPHASYSPPPPFSDIYQTDLYDGEIAFMDEQIGRVLKALADKKLADRTLVIAIGDHGESLGEHQEMSHAIFIYEATQHVPFLMRVPDLKPGPGRRLKTVVSQMDVMPTVLDYLGLPIPGQVIGESLRPLIEADPEPDTPRLAFMECNYTLLHYGWAPLAALTGQRYKYIKVPKPELYDLENDPHELKNLLEGDSSALPGPARSALALLRGDLDRKEKDWSGRRLESQEADVSEKDQAMMRALGYVVNGFQGNPELAAGKDPKDFADLLNVLQREQQAIERQEFDVALQCADTVLARDPENPQALFHRAYALFGVDKPLEALEAYHHMFELQKETSASYLDIGFIYIRLSQQDLNQDPETVTKYRGLAIEAFNKSIELAKPLPNREANYYLGRIYLENGDLGKAHEYFYDASLQDTDLGCVGKAMLYEREDRLVLAEAEFKKAAELVDSEEKGTYSTIYWTEWGAFLMRYQRAAEAVEFFEKALEKDKELVHEPRFMQNLNEAKRLASTPGPEK